MGSLQKILIAAVLLPLLIIGSIMGITYYKLQETMDMAVKQLSPFGVLKYGGLSTSITGQLTVKNISFDIRGTDDTVRIKSMSYLPPNPLYLFQDNDSLKQGRLPETMRLEILGMNMDLFGNVTENLEETVNLANANLKGINPLCGGTVYFGPRDYRDMGYEEVTIDSTIHYKFDKQKRTASITFTETMQDMGETYIKINLTGFKSDRISQLMTPEGMPRVSMVTIDYIDKSLYKRIVKNCAEKSAMPVEEYIDAEVNQNPEYFAYVWAGVIPGPGIRQAYQNFLLDPQSLSVSIQIPEDVTSESLNLFQSEDIPGLLNLQLSVNGRPVEDLSFTYFDGKISELSDRVEKSLDEKNAPPKKEKAKIQLLPPKYYKVSPGRLSKYVGKKVEVTTSSHQIREGKLIRISGNTVHLRRHISGGVYDMTVSMSRIKSVRVWLQKPK